MNIRDIFRKIRNTQKQEIDVKEQVNRTKKNDDSEIGLLDFLDADWRFFASRLTLRDMSFTKFNPEPITVNVTLDENNRPFADVVYQVKNSTEKVSFRFHQDKATVLKDGLEYNNKYLADAWFEFGDCVRGLKKVKRDQAANFHTKAVDEMFKAYPDAKPAALDFEELYKQEDQLIKENVKTIFECFGTDEDELEFAEYKIVYPDEVLYLNQVKPFSPRSLEFCVSRLADEAKNEIRNDVDAFREKCVKIALNSSLVSMDWERTIDVLVDVLDSQTKAKSTSNKNKTNTEQNVVKEFGQE